MDSNQSITGTSDEIDLRHLLGILLDGRYIITLLVGVFFVLALAYIFLATPIYKANGVILVEDHSPGVPGLSDMAEIFATESSSATELHVIKSRLVLGQVVDELDLTTVIRPVYIPIVGELLARDAVPMVPEDPPVGVSGYAGGGEVLKIREFVVPEKNYGKPFYVVADGDDRFSLWDDNYLILEGRVGIPARSIDGSYEISVSELIAKKGARFELMKLGRLESILALQKRLVVSERGKDTGIIEISLEGGNKDHISSVVDSVSANYYLQNVQRMAAEAENSLAFLDEQIPDIKAQLTYSEEALNNYRSEQTSVDLSLEAKSALESLVQVEANISTMSINEADISRRFTPKHPTYISFKRQQGNLERQRDKLNQRLEGLPDTQKRILQLKRDFEVNQAIFVALQNKRQELSILKASTVGNVRILDSAEVLPRAVAPKKGLIVIMSVLLGGMLGVMVVALKYFLNSGVKNPVEFTENGLMVQATIPRSENEEVYTKSHQFIKRYKESRYEKKARKPALLACDYPADLSVEALRSLRTSLHFSMIGAKNKFVMVSSASPGVGKSFITANLSVVIAQANKRVLLIDADMRKGYLHKRLAMNPEMGLSELLAGVASIDDAVKSTDIDGLDVILRGKVPSNPSELLMSEQLPSLFEDLGDRYDMIIVDTPPVLAVTDPAIIGSYCGTSIMITRFESCTLREVLAAKNRFEQNGVDIKGVVFNAVEKKASSYYYDYGYYNYEYKSDV